jgi:predicted nucleotidyltransferase
MTSRTKELPGRAAEFARILREHMPELRERYHVKSLALFGSYVRGEARRKSDLDVLVEYHSPPDLFDFVELKDHLADLLGIKVDLVMKSALRPTIGERILAEAIAV